MGILGCLLIHLAEGALPDNLPYKRYGILARVSVRLVMLYLLSLVYLAYQNEKTARQILKVIDPTLGVPVPHTMHTYDDNCEFEWINIYDNMDHYFLVHVVNWFLASIILRNRPLLHFWSVLDEVIELSVQHILPHFRECWWDHVILDILLSNTVAIEIGLLFIKLTGMEYYDWLGKKGKKSIRDWEVFHDSKRYGSILVIFFIIILNFMCGFFMINSLWVPPKCIFNIVRLLVWFLLANLAFREIHEDINQKEKGQVGGKFRWIGFFVCFTEILVSLKFLKDAGNIIQDFVTPVYIWGSWLAVTVILLANYFRLRLSEPGNKKIDQPKKQKQLEQSPVAMLRGLPRTLLCAMVVTAVAGPGPTGARPSCEVAPLDLAAAAMDLSGELRLSITSAPLAGEEGPPKAFVGQGTIGEFVKLTVPRGVTTDLSLSFSNAYGPRMLEDLVLTFHDLQPDETLTAWGFSTYLLSSDFPNPTASLVDALAGHPFPGCWSFSARPSATAGDGRGGARAPEAPADPDPATLTETQLSSSVSLYYKGVAEVQLRLAAPAVDGLANSLGPPAVFFLSGTPLLGGCLRAGVLAATAFPASARLPAPGEPVLAPSITARQPLLPTPHADKEPANASSLNTTTTTSTTTTTTTSSTTTSTTSTTTVTTTTSTTTGEFWNCYVGAVEAWSDNKARWCCLHEDRGCTDGPFDCEEDQSTWRSSWPGEKRRWCCKFQGLGCIAEHDCTADLGDWENSWTEQQKNWCCEHTGMGCPHECEAGEPSSWPLRRQQWCCRHHHRGCPAISNLAGDSSASSSSSGLQPLQPLHPLQLLQPLHLYDCDGAPEAWLEDRRAWCCRFRGLGCAPAGSYKLWSCRHGDPEDWAPDKRAWCCVRLNRGCVAKPFNCSVDSEAWDTRWPHDKQHWCCTFEQLGCSYSCSDSEQMTDSQRAWCCRNEGTGCPVSSTSAPAPIPYADIINSFDCQVGLLSWETAWSDAKKQWCCAAEQVACETYDCQEGLRFWPASWPEPKRRWCCEHRQLGCRFRCDGSAEDVAAWPRPQREYCCGHEGAGCGPQPAWPREDRQEPSENAWPQQKFAPPAPPRPAEHSWPAALLGKGAPVALAVGAAVLSGVALLVSLRTCRRDSRHEYERLANRLDLLGQGHQASEA